MPVCISNLGTALPPNRYAQAQTTEFIAQSLGMDASQRQKLEILHRASGVHYRHSVRSQLKDLHLATTSQRMAAYREHAPTLAAQAARACLDNTSPETITHLITVSCTGMYAPGLDIDLVGLLGLLPHVHRTGVNFMGCYGAFSGLKLAHSICSADMQAKVLVVCVELCSLHFQADTSPDALLSSALFADGAAAALVESGEHGFILQQFGCALLPDGSKDMTWLIGDYGFIMGLSAYVPGLIEGGLQVLLSRLEVAGRADFYAIHPGGKKILQAVESALGITAEQNALAYQVLRECGNMSSATFLFLLRKLRDSLRSEDSGKTLLGMAFGPGLTVEAASMKIGAIR